MIELTNLILIGSTGRNSGKTLLATKIIHNLKDLHSIIGLKITTIHAKKAKCPRGGKGCGVCSSLQSNYEIREEQDPTSGKDTSKLLNAGAKKVYWILALKDFLADAIFELLKKIDHGAIIVAESNCLRTIVKPGLFYVMQGSHPHEIKSSAKQVIHFANQVISFDQRHLDFLPPKITYHGKLLSYKRNATAIILAGGKSTRMGQDKRYLDVLGRPMLYYIYEQVKNRFDEVILCIGYADSGDYTEFEDALIVRDELADIGPLMGMSGGLKLSKHEVNFIVACDIPNIDFLVVDQMIQMQKSQKKDAVIPKHNNFIEPLHAIYQKKMYESMLRAIRQDKRKITDSFKQKNVLFMDFQNELSAVNINTFADYENFKDKNLAQRPKKASWQLRNDPGYLEEMPGCN